MSNGSPFEFYQFKDGAFDFWRCYNCGRLFTYEEERAYIRSMGEHPDRTVCKCGSMRYKPTRGPVGFEWIRPNVLIYTVKLILARGLAPWLETRFPSMLPFVERLVRPKEF